MAGHGFQLLPLLLLSFAFLVHGQQGFISIDCGKPSGYTYTDSVTGLGYVSDSEYVNAGENHDVADEFKLFSAASDLRSFPNGTRNCYRLKPVARGKKYLVRFFFKYGNYDGKYKPPVFDVYLGINFWGIARPENASVLYAGEMMVVAPADYISLCLVNTNSGTPFLSAIELRPVPDSVYQELNAATSLKPWFRHDYGGLDNIRFPKDPIDRLWSSIKGPAWKALAAAPNSILGTSNNYDSPEAVMATAVVPLSGSALKLSYSLNNSRAYHFFLHFAELLLLQPAENRTINISVNGAFYSSLSPDYLSITTVRSLSPQTFESGRLEISLDAAVGSTLPPLINAVEIYEVAPPTENITDSSDVDAMMDIKATYSLIKNWMGDPCSPRKFIWNGLNCSYSISSFHRIIALNLASSGLTGQLSPSFAKLTELQYLDLSNNNLTGEVAEFLGSLSHLEMLNLSNSGLNLPIPRALQDRANAGTLTLSMVGLEEKPNAAQDPGRSKKKSKTIAIAAAVSICAIVLVPLLVWVVWKSIKRTPARNSGIQVDMPPHHPDYREFTYSDLDRITGGFKKKLGQGGFGTVFYGVLADGTQVAVKVLSALSSQGVREFQAEAKLLMKIHHRNLVTLVGYCNDRDHLALVYECMAQGSVADHLSGAASGMNALGWGDRLRIASEAAQGLDYLHQGCKPAIIHRDIKTSNILLSQMFQAKIADFGLSRTFDHDRVTQISTAVKGTLGYLDPCYYSSHKLNEKSDVYAFGIVLLELITGLPAIIRNPEIIHIVAWVRPSIERGELENITDERIRGRFNDYNSIWKAVDIALSCVHSNPDERPLMSQVANLLKDCLVLECARSKQVPSNTSGPISNEFNSGDDSFVNGPSAR